MEPKAGSWSHLTHVYRRMFRLFRRMRTLFAEEFRAVKPYSGFKSAQNRRDA
jgi:hypothetical protein